MNPRLVALTGPLKGQIITLAAETSIGRGSSNHIAVSDPSLSRRHCLITGAEAGFTITDLGSSNGAYVNGVPVQETIAEYLQVAELRADELQRLHIDPPDDMPPDTKLTLRGGGTLIFDEFGELKFKVTNRVDHPVHQAERIKYLWEHGAFRGESTAAHFAELHRLRSLDRRSRPQERWF